MRPLKYLAFIILLFSLGVQGGHSTQKFSPSQSNYLLTISQSSITINQGDSFKLTAHVTLNGIDIDSVFFEVLDEDDIIIVDIGENQIYNGNGNYTLVFTSNSTHEIVPKNYSSNIVAYHNSVITKANFGFSVIGLDTIAPFLNVISPTNLTKFNETVFEVILEVTDDMFWKDININIGNLNIYYLKNTHNYSVEFPDLTYNATYLYLAVWVNLPGISNLNASEFSITVRDESFNQDVFGFELTGDYSKPIINWNSHQSNNEISSRNLTLQWSIIETSAIKSQVLRLNNKIFQPAGVVLRVTDRSLNFIIPIPDDNGQILIFELTVIDVFDNSNTLELRLIYDPEINEDNGITDNFSFDGENAIFALYGLLIVMFVGVIFYGGKKFSGREKSSISKNFIYLFNEKPQMNYSEFNPQVIFNSEINEILSEIDLTQIAKESKETVNLLINNMKSRFEYLIFRNQDDAGLKDMVENRYFKWIEELERSL